MGQKANKNSDSGGGLMLQNQGLKRSQNNKEIPR